jgi:SAM-dependent methyltransferase
MQPETISRLRNGFARVALEALATPGGEAREPFDSALPFSTMTEADWRKAVELWRAHAHDVLAAVPTRPCPACGSSQAREIFESYDAHKYHECGDCGCWFVPRRVNWSTFEAFFARSPEGAALARKMMNARDEDAKRVADMQRIGGYLDDLLPMLRDNRPVHYLDAGCGVGHSLRAGLERGLTVQGVEVDTEALALARAEGLPVAGAGDPLTTGPYRLLSFWETLEHIDDPLAALLQYLPHLDQDGLVAITVPNLNALETRTLREACSWVTGGYNTPGHVNLFHAPAIARLLDRAGLTLLEADGQFSGNPVELMAYLLGLHRGAFDVLDRSRGAAQLPAGLGRSVSEVWPGVSLLERQALASPILRVVACRKGSEGQFAAAVASRRDARRREMAEAAQALLATEPDYRDLYLQLQAEVERQYGVITSMQGEINRRDTLLEEERARYARTLDARLRRVAAKVARLAGRSN